MSEEMGTTSARRVADLLIELGGAVDPIGVNELARRVGISPTVAHRILQALLSRDLAVQDETSQKYRLGMGALQIGGGAFARLDFRRFAWPILERLVQETNLTATLSVLTGMRRMYVDQALPQTELRFSVELGVPYSLTRGSTGRAILATLPAGVIERIIDDDDEMRSAESRAQLMIRLSETRQAGYAIASGERLEGAGGVGRAFGVSGKTIVGALNVIGPQNLFSDERIKVYVRAIEHAGHAIDELLDSTSF